MADSRAVLLKKALSYLSRREHYRAELQSKLSRIKGTSADDIVAVLDGLEAEGLLSDVRYIEAFIMSRQAKRYGPVRIKMELQQKKLNAESVARILAAVDIDWQQTAQQCLRKKFPQKPTSISELAKQRNFLWRRGYSKEMIRKAITTDDDD